MGFCSKIKQRRILSAVFWTQNYNIGSISNVIITLDGLDFEVETNERKYQAFQILLLFYICLHTLCHRLKIGGGHCNGTNSKTILNKVVECSEAFWIFTLVDINEWSNFWGCEWNMVFSKNDFELLTSNTIWTWPQVVVFLQNFGIFNNALQL